MKPVKIMKQPLAGIWLLAAAMAGTLLFSGTRAQAAQPAAASPAPAQTPEIKGSDSAQSATAQAKPDRGKGEPNAGSAIKHSIGIDEILKMARAGVSKEVIKTFIENSPIAYNPSAADIIALKDQAVPDELTTALLKRGAQLRAQALQTHQANAVAPGYPNGGPRYGGFDPESYDFWWYHYAYPRALGDANQRMFAPYSTFSGFPFSSYGYYGPMPFAPLSPSAFRHP